MHSLRLAVFTSLVAGIAASASAADILVPQDNPDLKAALLAAQPGDRVIVMGGTWRNGRVVSGIQLVGRLGATLSGLWEIQGAGASVEGFAVRDGQIQVEADDVSIRLNRFSAPKYAVMVAGTGVSRLTIAGNRFNTATAQIEQATDVVMRSNRVAVGELIVLGNGTVMEDNTFVRRAQFGVHDGGDALVQRNRAPNMYVTGVDRAVVQDNVVRGGGLVVRGQGVLVTRNRVLAGRGLVVEGDAATVTENRVNLLYGDLTVRGDRVTVTDNVIDSRATPRLKLSGSYVFHVRGAGPASILRNEVRYRMRAGALIECDDAEIALNVVQGQSAASCLYVGGNRNNVHDNTLRQGPGALDVASTLTIEGDANVVADTTVHGAGYDGVSVTGADNFLARVHVENAGRCGITVGETATGTGLADCTADGARWSALFVLGTDTTVTNGSFTDGRKVDVLDLGTNTQFVSATFATKSEDEGLKPYR